MTAGHGFEGAQVHVLSFEGPDPYARVGGLGTRVEGLTRTLSGLGLETHLWFVGDPRGEEHVRDGELWLHRCCRRLGSGRPGGVYEDEGPKVDAYTKTVPAGVFRRLVGPLVGGGRAIVLAEDWQTEGAVLSLDALLRRAGLRDRVTLLWNANNTFGFERIDLPSLAAAASITAVSRYMRGLVQAWGVGAAVIPNGIDADGLELPDEATVARLRRVAGDRLILAKMARWDPTKGWHAAVRLVAEAKQLGHRPLLIARGGNEEFGARVLAAMDEAGLVQKRVRPNGEGIGDALRDVDGVDVVHVETHVDPQNRRLLFRLADAVLANSSHEPFGLVGLEAMAVGGIAVTGSTGEDYAIPGQNSLVLQTEDPREFFALYRPLTADPARLVALRRAARATAERYVWSDVVRRSLLPWIEVQEALQGRTHPEAAPSEPPPARSAEPLSASERRPAPSR